MQTPLRLKSERLGKIAIAESNPYLSVLVDTGVFHLDQEFDYSLPAKFDLNVGDWVSVPFHGRNCLGLITGRSSKDGASKLQQIKPINRAAKGPKISAEHLRLYQAVAKRWAVPIFDVLRFVSKYRLSASSLETSSQVVQSQGKRSYFQLPVNKDEVSALRELVNRVAKTGRTLLIVPEARIAVQFDGESSFDVAMRGGVLSPIKYQNVVILREESEHHFEIKSPGFNSRDVALLRNEFLNENLVFVGYAPSLEMVRLIENGYVSFKRSSGELKVVAKPSMQGELIPSALVKEFRSALSKGTVLVIAPTKGYGLAISCASCRNLAKCKCGGKLSKSSKSSPPTCVICATEFPEWRCAFCNKDRIYLVGRGIERIAEEFGKTFPNTDIHIATAEKSIEGEIRKRSIVLATIGSAPLRLYSATLILEGTNLGSDMRSEERFLTTLFKHAALSNGNIMVVERSEHPAINALVKWNPVPYLRRLVDDLNEAQLPPSSRHILIKSEDSERIYVGLVAALRENRIPANTRIHNLGNGVISIFFTHKNANSLLAFIYEFQKRRSISGKPLMKMRIDPYLLG